MVGRSGGNWKEAQGAPPRRSARSPLPAAAPAMVAAAAPVVRDRRTAGKVFDGACAACHAAGIAGAPKFGRQGRVGRRASRRGRDALPRKAINGFRARPA
jgi:cytochrome c5